jgi:hypothetical protein
MDTSLDNAIDVHVHTAPDVVQRSQSDIALANSALDAGMRGVVVKNHVVPTVGRVDLVNEAVGNEILYGGIALNGSVGGLNPEAVRVALQLGAKIVWLPTTWSALNARMEREAGNQHVRGQRVPSAAEQISLVRDGTLVDAGEEIISLIAEHDAVLATGHISPSETMAVAKACKREGADCLVNHPFARFLDASIEFQEQLADEGAYLEYCALTLQLMKSHDEKRIVEAVDRIGAEQCVLASDFGQVDRPAVAGFEAFVSSLLDAGLAQKEVEKMIVEQPATLLNLC